MIQVCLLVMHETSIHKPTEPLYDYIRVIGKVQFGGET